MKQKKTEIVAKDPKHKRFYIYRHKMVGEDQVLENLTHDSKWTRPFEDAWLIADHDVAVRQARAYKAGFPQRDVDFTVCVGAVDVIIDGFFFPELISKP